MIAIYYRQQGQIHKANSIEALDKIEPLQLVWLDLNNPEPYEKKRIENKLGIGLQDLEDAEEIEFSSRYHELPNMVIINSNFLVEEEGVLSNEIVSFILKNNTLISYRNADIKPFGEAVKRFKINSNQFTDGFSFLITLFETRIDFDADTLEDLSQRITDISKLITLEENLSEDVLIDITALQEGTMTIRGNIIDNQRVISALLRSDFIPDSASTKLRVLIRDIGSLLDFTNFAFERLEFLQNSFLGRVNLQQNRIVKIFTVVTVVFMPPTLIASIYGMNFRVMPEVEWAAGYPFALILMAVSSLVTLLYFKKKNWL
jgi:magnesium transporter